MRVFEFLPWTDWLALLVFVVAWLGYAWFAGRGHEDGTTLLHRTNEYRHYWLREATYRDPRMLDGLITQNLSATPAFFSSTTIIIIGGLLALLGASDRVTELVGEIPFAQPTIVEVFDLKILLLVGIFVYAFFRFSWSMRLYTFVALAIGSMPAPHKFEDGTFDRERHAKRASALVGMAAEAFNSGLRAYYMSFAAISWIFSSTAFILASAVVVAVLYRREFRSDVLDVLRT
jgi:uncharacterized membrane protein